MTCRTYLIDMFDMIDMTHSFICATWLIHMCDTTHSYVWHDSFICVTWLIHMCDMAHSCAHFHHPLHTHTVDLRLICVACLIHTCHMSHHSSTHTYMCEKYMCAKRQESSKRNCYMIFPRVIIKAIIIIIILYVHMYTIDEPFELRCANLPCVAHTYNWYVWYDSFTRVTCLIHMCGMFHSHVWHASFKLCDMPQFQRCNSSVYTYNGPHADLSTLRKKEEREIRGRRRIERLMEEGRKRN